MPRTPEEQHAMQLACYGTTKEDVLNQFNADVEDRCYTGGDEPTDDELKGAQRMTLVSLLSDVQELIVLDQRELARQRLNVAKMIILEELS